LSKPTSSQGVVLWDIDGTLISSHTYRTNKHVKAVELFLGCILPNQEPTAGKTDRQILRELLEMHGDKPSSAALTEVLGILDSLSVEEIRQFPIPTILGANAAINKAHNSGWVNGLLTGNTPARARSKLESASLWENFDLNFAYFGDVASNRINLVGQSVTAIRSEGFLEIVIIGDTPLDILSAQEHGIRVVGVSTGLYSVEDLSDLNPDLLISDWESGLVSFLDFLVSLKH
jgi:phosphoglycolate phosphatase